MHEADKKRLGWRRYFVAPCTIGFVLMLVGVKYGWDTLAIIGGVLFIGSMVFLPTDMRSRAPRY